MADDPKATVRCRAAMAAVLIVTGLLLSGCSASRYRQSADNEAYGIIRDVESHIFGRTNQFSIDTPYSSRKPDEIPPQELIEDRLQTNRRVLSIEGALDLAVRSSRTYQSEKERLYLAALSLTGNRFQFSPQFFAQATPKYERTATGEQILSLRNSSVGFNQVLKSGGSFGVKLVNDFLRYYTGDPRQSIVSTLSVNLAQPLLRGFGKNNPSVEALTQAERDVVYAVRTYAFFQDQFAMGVVNDYFNLLLLKDTIYNQYANYLSRSNYTVRLDARKDRETKSGIDQARQSELSAKTAYVNAVASYFNALDTFKIKLGLSLGERLFLDDSSLKEIQQAGPLLVVLPREQAYRLAVEKYLPVLNVIDRFEDSKRKVRVVRDQLRMDLNLTADAALDSARPTDYTTFDPSEWRGSVGLEIDLPVNRLRERNAYRTSLVTFESNLRSLTLALDALRDNIQRGMRTLERSYQDYVIQTNALALAEDRVASTSMMQQAGLVPPRDVIESQDDLISAQNAVTSALVEYLRTRLQLLLDLGILETKTEKFWLADQLSSHFDQAAQPESLLDVPHGQLIAPDVLFSN